MKNIFGFIAAFLAGLVAAVALANLVLTLRSSGFAEPDRLGCSCRLEARDDGNRFIVHDRTWANHCPFCKGTMGCLQTGVGHVLSPHSGFKTGDLAPSTRNTGDLDAPETR